MKSLVLLLATLSLMASHLAFAESGELKITADMLQLDYAQSEGAVSLDCTPTLEDAQSQDWIVQCGEGARSETRRYRVHLWVTLYERATTPRQSYEVLYWITDLSPGATPAASASSTTIWFNFEDPAKFTQIDLRLGVENDTAGLHLVITPPAAMHANKK